jgi:hypothetical protein
MMSVEQLAKAAYEAYCQKAGGKTFGGKPPPLYAQLDADSQSQWIAAVQAVRAEIAAVH